MFHILVADDDKNTRRLMQAVLEGDGYTVTTACDGEEALAVMDREHIDLVVLDIMLPGEDGITILKKLRAGAATANIPIIMATAKGSEFDKVIGLDTGADDYLVKPFGMMEMVARIKAVMRRTAPKTDQVLTCGDIVLDEVRHIVTVDGKQVVLTLKEYELLKLLMENAGQVFTRDILLSRIWGQDYLGETRTVDVHIGTLRTKLAKGGEKIETVRGVGYKMVE